MTFMERLEREFQIAKDHAYEKAKEGDKKEFNKYQIQAETIEEIIQIAKYYPVFK